MLWAGMLLLTGQFTVFYWLTWCEHSRAALEDHLAKSLSYAGKVCHLKRGSGHLA